MPFGLREWRLSSSWVKLVWFLPMMMMAREVGDVLCECTQSGETYAVGCAGEDGGELLG